MRLPLAALLIAGLTGAPAQAFTLGGDVTGGSGGFVKLDPSEAFAVGEDTFDDPNLYAFDESQNIELPFDLRLDIAGPEGPVLPAGVVIASHYVFFDPGFGAWQRGYVDFDAPILGIAAFQDTMAATDFLANTAVTYISPELRGLEHGDRVWVDEENPYRLWVYWAGSSPGDYVRVFTAHSIGAVSML